MKKKFFLPMMAFVFAIGLSFATERSTSNPSMDFYLDGNEFEPIGAELDCGFGVKTCVVQMEDGGPEFVVYDAPAHGTEKTGSGDLIEYWKR